MHKLLQSGHFRAFFGLNIMIELLWPLNVDKPVYNLIHNVRR